MRTGRKSQGVTPSTPLRAAVTELVRSEGVRGASAMLGGVSRESIVRIVGGVPVRAGTIEVVERRLADLADNAERTGGAA